MDPSDIDKGQECSFCGADPEHVERLFVAEKASICDRCIRSLAVEEAVNVSDDPGPVHSLLGRWTRNVGDNASVSLDFKSDGTLRATTIDGSGVTNKLLRYTFNGSELSVVELIACGDQETSTVEVFAEVLTLRTKRGESVFKREEPDV